MAWTAPRTWVQSELVTPALLNTHLRDNLREVVRRLCGAGGPVGNAASSVATDAFARSIAAGELGINGDTLRITVFGVLAANGNTKQADFTIGGQTIYSFSSAASGALLKFEIIISRVTATTSRAWVNGLNSATPFFSQSNPAVTWASANTLKAVLTSSGADDIRLFNYTVELIPGTGEDT